MKGLDGFDYFFDLGECPPTSQLLDAGRLCEWRVQMLSGPIPDLGDLKGLGRWFRHRKSFSRWEDSRIEGCNLFFEGYHWGWFKVLTGMADDKKPALIFHYDTIENGRIVRRIRDVVRAVPNQPNLLLGKAYLRLQGKSHLLGRFSLVRISNPD